MRKLIAGGIALVALAAGPGAMAADLAVKPKEPAFTVYNWTGFYVGIEGGTGWSSGVIQTDARPFTSGSYQPNGGVIGGTV